MLPDAVCHACLLRPSLNLIICIYSRFQILSEVLLCYMCVSFFSTAPIEVNRRLNGSILNLKCHAWPFFEVASLYEMASMYQWTSTLQEWRLVKKGLSPDWETWQTRCSCQGMTKRCQGRCLFQSVFCSFKIGSYIDLVYLGARLISIFLNMWKLALVETFGCVWK